MRISYIGMIGLLVGVAASRPPADALREANAAAKAGRFDLAAERYQQAAQETLDPGLVAFNRGRSSLEQGDYLAAELDFRRCLDDAAAPPDRRARAYYNWGVAALQRGQTATVYRTAIACFNQALAHTDEPMLRADSQHNLELAKQLWLQARAQESQRPQAGDRPPDAPPPVQPKAPKPSSTEPDPANSEPGSSSGKAEAQPGQAEVPPGTTPQQTEQQTAGAGSKPVLLDPAREEPLTPEQARVYLKQAAERIARDRRTTARLVAGPDRPHVRDW